MSSAPNGTIPSLHSVSAPVVSFSWVTHTQQYRPTVSVVAGLFRGTTSILSRSANKSATNFSVCFSSRVKCSYAKLSCHVFVSSVYAAVLSLRIWASRSCSPRTFRWVLSKYSFVTKIFISVPCCRCDMIYILNISRHAPIQPMKYVWLTLRFSDLQPHPM